METREMKRLSILGMAALMAAAVSCKKSGDDTPAPVHGAFRAVAEAQTDDSKTGMDGDLKVFWSSNDQIRIFDHTSVNETTIKQGDFTITNGIGESSGEFGEPFNLPENFYNDNYRAFYPATIASYENSDYYMNLSNTQVYAKNSFGVNANPMAAKAESTSLGFSNLCGTLRLSLTGSRSDMVVKSITVTTRKEEKLCGKGKVVFEETTPTLEMTGVPNNNEKSVTLNCGNGVTLPLHNPDPEVKSDAVFNIVLPAGTLQKSFEIEVAYSTAGKDLTFKKSTSGIVANTIQAGHVRNMPALRIDHGFVVDNNCKTVEFAKGNLYWKRPTSSAKDDNGWGIEEHPWGSCFDYSISNPQWNPDYVSQFLWTDDAANAVTNTYIAGTTNTFFTETNTTGFPITVNNQTKYYHTLSSDEWDYVINKRPVQFHRWAKVYMAPNVTGKNVPEKALGLLLFPAEWTEPAVSTGYTPLSDKAFIDNVAWEVNDVINEEDLYDGKTYAGCVFLPGPGFRNTNNPTCGNVGIRGYYWSSTKDNTSNISALHLNFDNGAKPGVFIRNGVNELDGFTVRPVRW